MTGHHFEKRPYQLVLLGVFVPAFFCLPCAADLRDDFLAAYPTASAQLEETYSHVRIVTTETESDDAGKFSYKRHCEYLREGLLCRKVATVVEALRPGMHVGSTSVGGGSSDKYFSLGRVDSTAQFALYEFGPKSPGDFMLMCAPVFATYAGDNMRIKDLLAAPYTKVVSAEKALIDEMSVVDVLCHVTPGRGPTQKLHLYFLPGSWAFAGWSEPLMAGPTVDGNPRRSIELRVAYTNDDPRQLKMFRRWMTDSKEAGRRTNESVVQIDSVEFRHFPTDDFTVGAFGVVEPVPAKSRMAWLLPINIFVLLALGIWMSLVARRRKKKVEERST